MEWKWQWDGNGNSNFLVHEHAAKIRNEAKQKAMRTNTKHTTDNGNCPNGEKKNQRKNNTAKISKQQQ